MLWPQWAKSNGPHRCCLPVWSYFIRSRVETMKSPLKASCRFVLIIALLVQPVFGQFSLVDPPRTPAVRAAQEDTALAPPEFILTNERPTPPPPPPKPPMSLEDDGFEVPDPQIMGAERPIKVGELIQLWVQQPEQEPEDLASTKYSWTVLPSREVVVWPDGKRIIFGTGSVNTTYVVVMTASYVFVEKEPDGSIGNIVQKTVTKIAAVEVTGGTTGTPGTPPVNPPDNPTTPDLSGLSKLSYDWVAQVSTSSTYDATAARADAAQLAASFRSVAAKIGNGEYTDVSTILRQTKASNDAAIDNRNAWMPWFTQLSDYLNAAFNDETIKTPAQFQRAWLDIAVGLDAASR